jgi:hypothetical protein
VPRVLCDNGNADYIGGFSWRSDGCVGELTSLEKNRDDDVSKGTQGEEVVVGIVWKFLASNAAGSRGVAEEKYL